MKIMRNEEKNLSAFRRDLEERDCYLRNEMNRRKYVKGIGNVEWLIREK